MALFSRSNDKNKPAGNGNGNGHGANTATAAPHASAVDRLKDSPVFKQIPTSATPPAQVAPPPQQTERQAYLIQMRVKIHQKLVERLNVQNLRSMPINVVRQEVRALIRELYQSEKGL